MWTKAEDGNTIGQVGSENGVIILDEEYLYASRITLERDGIIAPYSITCGVYGMMAHTAFADQETEAMGKYDGMKKELQEFIDSEDDDKSGEWCERFANHW